VVAAPADAVDSVTAALASLRGCPVTVVAGGATRHESVAAALAVVPREYDIVLVHDAARALTPPAMIERVAHAVRTGRDAVIPVLPVIDTIKQVGDGGVVRTTVQRAALRAVQTPQGFRREVLTAAHRLPGAGQEHTDDAGLVELLGVPVWTVPGDESALKITRPLDLEIGELLLRQRHGAAAS
jgi:2-C-methyl-D-erythritol 4-phosphate cytidylyltransferase